MPATVEALKVATLVHPTSGSQYDFRVFLADDGAPELVGVVHTLTRKYRNEYALPPGEARLLWAQLTAKGYERF